MSSSIGKGKPEDFISRNKTWCWTKNQQNSWFCLDLGPSKVMYVTHYTIRYASSGKYACPRNWKLQGSNVFSSSSDPNDITWFTIKTHTNDTSITSEHQRYTWNISVGQAFRYFRIIQTGKNNFSAKSSQKEDDWSNVLVISGFELYGTLYTGSFATNVLSKKSSPAHDFKYRSTHDRNGVIHNLKHNSIRVTCSRIAKGNPEDFIERGKVHCWTCNEPYSWFCVDLGPNRALVPNNYTFQYGSSGNYACPRNWTLQGSNTYNTSRALNDPNWITLRAHTNDTSINSDYYAKSWSINCIQAFRYFRIIQTGKNCYRVPPNTTDGWSDVLVASGFEIYGTLYDLDFSMCPCVEYPFTDTLEANGIIYHLGNQVNVDASGVGTGSAEGFISRDKVCNWTTNEANSWYSIDLGVNRSVLPTHYTLGYASGGNSCVPRNWKLQASNSTEEATWETLRAHENDTTLNFDYEIATWSVKANKAYRYFRIQQSGKNAYVQVDEEDLWSQVLAVNGFELYGTLYSGEGPKTVQSYISPHGLNELHTQSEMAASAISTAEPSGFLSNSGNAVAEKELKSFDPFAGLPRELVLVIFSYLTGPLLLHINVVCKRWKTIAEENTLWKHMCIKDWKINANDFFMSHERNWKSTYLRSKMVGFVADDSIEDDLTTPYSGSPLGILHSLWSNSPETYFRLASSGTQKGAPHEFLSRENTFCWTTHRKNSWYRLDLGKYVKVIPTHYTLKYGSSANYCCPRFWNFQASNSADVEASPDDESLWTTIRVHDNDASMNSDFAWLSYKVECTTAYRYFRVVQTGPNTFNTKGQGNDVWSDVLVTAGFDLFGLCIKVKPCEEDPVEIRQRV